MKKNFILLAFVLVLLSTAVFGGFVRPAVAEETIYIRADGSIEGTTDISTIDNTTYTFTNNINESIVVERDDIVVDGAGYTLQGTGSGYGFSWISINNVTIKNTNIKGFSIGISPTLSSDINISWNNITSSTFYDIYLMRSSNNSISRNRITASTIDNMYLYSSIYLFNCSNIEISGNNITSSTYASILLEGSSNNSISGNDITASIHAGTWLDSSSKNTIYGNNIANNNNGIGLDGSSNNMIYHNNIIDNVIQVNIVADGSSDWDDGVDMGNYWSDYESRYPNATEVDGSGIWDTPYVIDGNNQDNYPIIPEFPTLTSTLLALILLAVVITTYKHRLLKTPIH